MSNKIFQSLPAGSSSFTEIRKKADSYAAENAPVVLTAALVTEVRKSEPADVFTKKISLCNLQAEFCVNKK